MGRKKFSTAKLIGLVIAVVGLVVLVIGIINFVEFRQSVGGKIAGSLGKAFGSTPKQVTQSIFMMIGGAAGLIVGGIIAKKG
ncbi:hypothetical protein AGMMS50212_02420 [Spirochaetia bacterium]|nr:hypothetical protein AGMMS50212_02420 [Spirochaetia bacterium]